MPCFESSATHVQSLFHTTYLTRGTCSSASTRRLCCSKSVMRSSERSSSRPDAPAKNMPSVLGLGGATFFVTSFAKFLMRIWRFLSSTAKRLRAMKTAARPEPRFTSCESALRSPPAPAPPPRPSPAASFGNVSSSYVPDSASEVMSTLFSAGLSTLYESARGPLPSPAVCECVPARRSETTGTSRPEPNSCIRR